MLLRSVSQSRYDRATIGEVAIAIAEVTTNQGFQSFVSNEKTFNEFLYYWIVNNKKSFIERASGSTFLEISKSKIQPMEISLPCLEEQTKIANFLSAIDQKLKSLHSKLNKPNSGKKACCSRCLFENPCTSAAKSTALKGAFLTKKLNCE